MIKPRSPSPSAGVLLLNPNASRGCRVRSPADLFEGVEGHKTQMTRSPKVMASPLAPGTTKSIAECHQNPTYSQQRTKTPSEILINSDNYPSSGAHVHH